MTATTIPTTHPIDAVRTAGRPVWRVAAGAGVLAAVAAEVTALIGRLAGVPLEAGGVGAERAEPIPLLGFVVMTLTFAAAGLVLAVVLARRATHAARLYAIVTTVVVALSLLGPATAGATTTATKVVLALTHVVAAAVAIPLVARRLARH